jgi:hypothetical protein
VTTPWILDDEPQDAPVLPLAVVTTAASSITTPKHATPTSSCLRISHDDLCLLSSSPVFLVLSTSTTSITSCSAPIYGTEDTAGEPS